MKTTALRPVAARGGPRPARRVRGAQIGRVVAVRDGRLVVDYPAAARGPRPAVAATASPYATPQSAVGHHVALLFEDGDPDRPIVAAWVEEGAEAAVPRARDLRVDGRRLVIAAEAEIELRCGESSLVLTSDGRVTIRGRNLVSQAKEINKIRGAAVRLN